MKLQLKDLTALDLVNMLSSTQQNQVVEMLEINADDLQGASAEAEDYLDHVATLIRKHVGTFD